MRRFDKAKTLIASNNPIADLKGAQLSSCLKSIVLKGTPLSEHKYYRLMILVSLAPNATDIDYQKVTSREISTAKKIQEATIGLISNGYVLTDMLPVTLTKGSESVIIPDERCLTETTLKFMDLKARQTMEMAKQLSSQLEKTVGNLQIPVDQGNLSRMIEETERNTELAYERKKLIREKRLEKLEQKQREETPAEPVKASPNKPATKASLKKKLKQMRAEERKKREAASVETQEVDTTTPLSTPEQEPIESEKPATKASLKKKLRERTKSVPKEELEEVVESNPPIEISTPIEEVPQEEVRQETEGKKPAVMKPRMRKKLMKIREEQRKKSELKKKRPIEPEIEELDEFLEIEQTSLLETEEEASTMNVDELRQRDCDELVVPEEEDVHADELKEHDSEEFQRQLVVTEEEDAPEIVEEVTKKQKKPAVKKRLQKIRAKNKQRKIERNVQRAAIMDFPDDLSSDLFKMGFSESEKIPEYETPEPENEIADECEVSQCTEGRNTEEQEEPMEEQEEEPNEPIEVPEEEDPMEVPEQQAKEEEEVVEDEEDIIETVESVNGIEKYEEEEMDEGSIHIDEPEEHEEEEYDEEVMEETPEMKEASDEPEEHEEEEVLEEEIPRKEIEEPKQVCEEMIQKQSILRRNSPVDSSPTVKETKQLTSPTKRTRIPVLVHRKRFGPKSPEQQRPERTTPGTPTPEQQAPDRATPDTPIPEPAKKATKSHEVTFASPPKSQEDAPRLTLSERIKRLEEKRRRAETAETEFSTPTKAPPKQTISPVEVRKRANEKLAAIRMRNQKMKEESRNERLDKMRAMFRKTLPPDMVTSSSGEEDEEIDYLNSNKSPIVLVRKTDYSINVDEIMARARSRVGKYSTEAFMEEEEHSVAIGEEEEYHDVSLALADNLAMISDSAHISEFIRIENNARMESSLLHPSDDDAKEPSIIPLDVYEIQHAVRLPGFDLSSPGQHLSQSDELLSQSYDEDTNFSIYDARLSESPDDGTGDIIIWTTVPVTQRNSDDEDSISEMFKTNQDRKYV